MAFRIAIGGINQEINTFCWKSITHMDKFLVQRGDEIITQHKGCRTFEGGILDLAEKEDLTMIPTVNARAYPSGVLLRLIHILS